MAWVLSELMIQELAKVLVMSKFSAAATFFKISNKKLLSAPSFVKLPISSLLKEQKTEILSDSLSKKLSKEAYTLVKLSILGERRNSFLGPNKTGSELSYKKSS